MQFFSPGKSNLSTSYFSTLYPCFIHPLHIIIERNVAYTQNYITNAKKNALQFLKKFPSSGLKAQLHSAYLL